jgi:hypothetical protein
MRLNHTYLERGPSQKSIPGAFRELEFSMKKSVFEHLGIVLLLALAVTASGQNAETGTAASAQGRVVGVVTSVDKAANQIAVKTDTGEANVVVVASSSSLLRLPPGETSAQKAVKITLEEIAVGDRLFARGNSIGDGKSFEARQVVVTAGAAAPVAQDQQQRDDFRQRGIVGRIARIDVQKKEIALQSRGREGVTPATIVVTDATRVFRYAPDSLNITHASRSSLSQMRVGDQLRALGERSTDGTRFTATEIIAGSMTRTGGQVVAVDAARNELTIKNNQGQTVTVAVGQRSSLRRITPEVAASFAARPGRAGSGQEGRPRERRERPAGANGEARRGSGGGEGRPARGGRGFQEMLAGLPVITLSDLKKGDSVFISGSEGADASHVTAIMLITGDPTFLERFLQRGPNRGPQSPGLPGGVMGGGVGRAEPPNNP